jgi:proline iminopeptidase
MNGELLTLDNGIRLWTARMGKGDPVLIPNGEYFVEDLRELADEFTLIAYDPRNRGRSERVLDGDRLVGDIQLDMEDMECLRQSLGIERLNLLGHSYMGLGVVLYGMTYPAHVNRIVQIGPAQPFPGKRYPAELSWNDGVAGEVFGKLGQLRGEAAGMDPVEACRKASAILAVMCVANAADAGKIDWGRCELENERNLMKYLGENLMPSLQRLEITPEMFAKVQCPVLTIHGRKDRNVPYGAAIDWANSLPKATLVTVDDAAHAPWVEAPQLVVNAIRGFFKPLAQTAG